MRPIQNQQNPLPISMWSEYDSFPISLEESLHLQPKKNLHFTSAESIYNPLVDFKIPNFLNIQTASFKHFLNVGLIEKLNTLNNMQNSDKRFEIYFYSEKYKISVPKWTPSQAILKRKTYNCQLYVPVQLTDLSTKQITFQWIKLATLPMMTKYGHFIINGSPRIIMNQIVRSPGVYFHQSVKDNHINIYSADFIAEKGAWLRLEVDPKTGAIWAKLKKTPKIPLLLFLRCFGVDFPVLNNYLQCKNLSKSYEKTAIDETILFQDKKQALVQLSKTVYPTIKPESIYGQMFLFRKFLNPRSYSLSLLGRARLNQKLGLCIPHDYTFLTGQDILFACLFLLDLVNGNRNPDDIDDLKNRKVKPCGELIQMQFQLGLSRLEKHIFEQYKQIPYKKLVLGNILNSTAMNSSLREFFGTNPLSQLMDQTNALAELTHKRRLSCLGPGGIQRETANMAIRGIHETHYGRICPIETPEGQNAGLVNSITIYAKLNPSGFLETTFWKTYKGHILNNKDPLLFDSDQERDAIIAPGDMKCNDLNFLPKSNSIPSRKQSQFQLVSREDINYIALSPVQMISVATALIPFLEHDDGNRALMGSNMQRQAVPTIKPSKPIVGTGLESRVISDIGQAKQARQSGFVTYVDGNEVVVFSFVKRGMMKKVIGNFSNYDSESYLKSNVGKDLINTKPLKPIKYELDKFHRSNQDTYMVHRPVVQVGSWVEKGDLLADSSSSQQGELSLGQNILVGYTPWEGYNFEDAVLISSRLISDDLYTSLHIERYEVEVRDTQFGMEQITCNLSQSGLDYLDHLGIAKIGTWVEHGDILVGKITPIDQKPLTPYEKLLYDILGKKVPKTRNTSLTVPKNVHGRVIHVEIIETDSDFISKRPIKNQKQSKSNHFKFSHEIISNDYLKNQNQEKSIYDSIIDSKWQSYLNRDHANLDFSLRFGLDDRSEKSPSNLNLDSSKSYNRHSGVLKVHIYLAEKRSIQVGDKIAGRHGNKGIVSNILPRQDMPYLPDGTPLDLVLNPLGVPSRMNVGQIFECLLGLAGSYLGQNYKIQPFDELYGCEASRSLVYSKLYEARIKTGQDWLFNPNNPGKIQLFDGRTGSCFSQPVTVGKSYILKLVHLVDEKIHARSTGPYSLVTQQPLRGRSKQGGQRVGEMEVWALEGFGAAYILQELLTIKSDAMHGRQQLIHSILDNKPLEIGTPESFKVLIRELQSVCLDIYTSQLVGKFGKRAKLDMVQLP
uniref:DNA-directed RNA polymerase subunit beta n=1 Tax=Capsosiphon fulvescens TaxID=205396 RepID=A0A3P8MUM2_9CHLO|nr:beta subunit of RNA polymerase [Capsosiphon fulvescens]AWX64087.1 beta subunit of RNA polymerase [Capsosiphon fulvescens]